MGERSHWPGARKRGIMNSFALMNWYQINMEYAAFLLGTTVGRVVFCRHELGRV